MAFRFGLAIIVLATFAAGCHAAGTTDHQRLLARRPLVYMTFDRHPDRAEPKLTTTWHVVWCRFRRGVRVQTTTVPAIDRRYRYAPHWAYETTKRGEYRAMVNGAVYNQSVTPSVPIGGVGHGEEGWATGDSATHAKYCFGFTADGRKTASGAPAFRVAPMVPAFTVKGTSADNVGKPATFYTVARDIKRNYPYGLGCVGLLINPGGWPQWNPLKGGWQDGESLGPKARLARTAICWTKTGDMFFITCSNPREAAAKSATGADWGETIDFLSRYMPAAMKSDYPYLLRRHDVKRIDGAVMLDGGGSTMLGYKHLAHDGDTNIDHAPHGPESQGNDMPLIPDFVYAVGRNRE